MIIFVSAKAGDGTHSGDLNFSRKLEKILTFRKSSLYSFCLSWLYALVICGYPLLANLSIYFELHSRVIGISAKLAVLLLSGIIVLWIGLVRGRMYVGVLLLPLSVFWILFVGRIVMDTMLDPVILTRPGFEYFAYAVGGCLLPMLAFMVLPDGYAIERAFRITYIASTLAVLLLLVNVLIIHPDASYWAKLGRLGAESLNPITVGHLAATIIILSIAKLMGYSGRGNKLATQAVALLIATLGFVTLVLAASKGPVLALFVAVSLMVMARLPRSKWKPEMIVLVGAGLILVSIASVYAASRLGSSLTHRLEVLMQGRDAGVDMRLELLSEAWRLFFQYPISGSGLEVPGYGSYPHNVVVESYMATGLVGGLAFTILVMGCLILALRIMYYSRIYTWIGMLFIQYMTSALVSGALVYSTAMWSLIGAVLGLSYISRNAAIAPVFRT